MQDTKYIHTAFIAVIAMLVIIAMGVFSQKEDLFSGDGGLDAQACTMVATTSVSIGNQSSTEIVASASNNAYIVVTQPTAATNTVSIGFGQAATLSNGYKLGSSTSAYLPNVLEAGLNTDFPYVGSITAITNLGSTTIGVTVCRYN